MEEEDNKEPEYVEEKTTIKHIVIAGGGATGFSFYGILKETNRLKQWDINNIHSIYGTSIGAALAVVLCLKYDWNTIDDYLIKRPWNNVYKFNMYSLIDSYHKRGMFDIKSLEETLSPLFNGKDISMDVTMKEFYDLTNIELHMFATELNSYELIDFSYKSHPDWKVVEVAYCSACLPVMFSPFIKENKCYCDGGVIKNYPLEACIKNVSNTDEILGIRRINKKGKINTVDEKSSLLDFMMILLNNFSKKMFVLNNDVVLKNEYVVESDPTSILTMHSVLTNMEERIQLIQDGIDMVNRKFVDVIHF
jgi:predicted acylesterase/phospholipase RssA